MLVMFMATEMMMKMMANTQRLKIRAFNAPCCENVLHIVGTTPPTPKLVECPDELMLQISMDTCPRGTGIRGAGHPSSYMNFIPVTDNDVPQI